MLMDVEKLIELFKKIHEDEHKIWFAFEEIKKILEDCKK
jgi:hypothetical protein